MPPRVIFDNSAILNGMTPVPQRGSIIWHWMRTKAVQAITSDHLVIELTKNLADPRFRLGDEAQATIVAEYLQYAELFEHVPPSGAFCRDPKDIPVLDLAIWQEVDAIVSSDPDLLVLDGEFKFDILRAGDLHPILEAYQAKQDDPEQSTHNNDPHVQHPTI